ncbi:hypothetical protein TEQG_00591 [Trichophyton equinum CBS 127.97]|uniref:Uncharacterized protein n=1 Tax=Trichophyton equinum (strain ATCC MYA-4606 / CBS 127.97) TaxID=559882 RepID=F2PHY3_TRIEC|nr:hypothetical protein TEQG_00591 [Trichophyton equinum CBS 127.97]
MDPSLFDENPEYKQPGPGDHNLTFEDAENETLGDDYRSSFVDSQYWPVLDFPPLTNGSTRGTNDDSFPQEHQADEIYEHPLHIEAGDTGNLGHEIGLLGVSTWQDIDIWRDWTTISVSSDSNSTVGSSGDLIEECNQLTKKTPSPPWSQLGLSSATNMAWPQPVQLLPNLPRYNPTIYAGSSRRAAESNNNRASNLNGVNERREETLSFHGVTSRPIKRPTSFRLPCDTPQMAELMMALLPGELLTLLEETVNRHYGEGQGRQLDTAEDDNIIFVHLAANAGPSMVLPIVRLKPNLPSDSEGTTIYVRDDIKKVTVIWDEWLDTVANDQLNQSCKLVFSGSHDWVLPALDMVCSFASAALQIPSIGGEDKVNNPSTMLHCSVRLCFAIYLMSTPLEVSGMGIESEKERIEVEYQFKSKARSILENLISKISKDLNNLICKKRRQYAGHILATLVFLSFSCHFNQLIRLRLAIITGNESSTKADIDAMNRNIHCINELVYSTFRPQIEQILKPQKQDPHTPGGKNQDQLSTSTEELRQVNSKLIRGLWSTVTNISKTETGNELRQSVQSYDTATSISTDDASRALFDAIAPLTDKNLQPLGRMEK